MRTSIILALVAGLVPAISALPSKRFEDHVSLGFYNSNPKKTFQSVHDIKPAGANKNVAGTFLMYIGDAKEFTWSEDGSSKKHKCTATLKADPDLANVRWDLDSGAGQAAPADKQNPKRLPIAGSVEVKCD